MDTAVKIMGLILISAIASIVLGAWMTYLNIPDDLKFCTQFLYINLVVFYIVLYDRMEPPKKYS